MIVDIERRPVPRYAVLVRGRAPVDHRAVESLSSEFVEDLLVVFLTAPALDSVAEGRRQTLDTQTGG